MSALLSIAMPAVAAILFYKLVERRHKVLLAKIMGVCVLLGLAGVGAVAWFEHDKDTRYAKRRAALAITYRPDTALHRNPFLAALGIIDTTDHISFDICNHSSDTVMALRFRPTTFMSRRTTPYPVVLTEGNSYSFDLDLRSDYRLVPGECVALTWQGAYRLMDSIAVELGTVRFAGDPQWE